MGKMNGGNNPSRQKRLTRLQVMINNEELRALDDFRYKKHMPSRAASIREILRRGLAADGFAIAHEESHSEQFGIIRDETRSGSKV